VIVALLGLGLIGGSVARAAVGAGMTVRAWTPTGRGPEAAASDGIVPVAGMDAAVAGADLVVLAAPPLACLELVGRLATSSDLGPDAVVTDVASTKAAIVAGAHAVGLRFVGGHPLAGRESSGYRASDPDLFRDRPWVIVPPDPPDREAEARVAALVDACGARPIRTSAADHDRAVASISHLPLLLSAALAETVASEPDWLSIRELAAGGWSSMTRLARGDVEMGAGILATNAANVRDQLRLLRATLEAWEADLDAPDVTDRAAARLGAARAALEDGEA
jgi:prephenate dehydrogenase